MSVFASLLSAALAARLASLDLCADEYLLLLAPRSGISSVSHLGHDPHDSVLAKRAKGLPANRGTLESVVGSGARTLLTTRPLGRLDKALAARLGMNVVMLETGDPEAVARSVARVAALSGGRKAARAWTRRLRTLRANHPHETVDALWIGPAGIGMTTGDPAARWLALAGITPQTAAPGGGRIEALLSSDAPLVLRSTYDAGNYSLAGAWLDHPLVTRDSRRTIKVDGRRFTCSGPLMLREIERLKRALAR